MTRFGFSVIHQGSPSPSCAGKRLIKELSNGRHVRCAWPLSWRVGMSGWRIWRCFASPVTTLSTLYFDESASSWRCHVLSTGMEWAWDHAHSGLHGLKPLQIQLIWKGQLYRDQWMGLLAKMVVLWALSIMPMGLQLHELRVLLFRSTHLLWTS